MENRRDAYKRITHTYTHTHTHTHTLSLSPAVWVSLCLSEPARSTRLSREVFIFATLFLLSCKLWYNIICNDSYNVMFTITA